MNLLTIAWKSVKQRKLASLLTALSVALGVMAMVIVLVFASAVDGSFNQRAIGWDLIIGPQGSEQQLVLSAVYRIQGAIGNLPYAYWDEIKSDRRVVAAVPLAFGDATEQGAFPIVGTTGEYFQHDYMPDTPFQIRGKRINGLYDAIIGSEVARVNNWDVGTQFQIQHGGGDKHIHDDKFTVVAVIRQTGTPNDRTVFINLEGFLALDGHSKPVDEVRDRIQKFYAEDPTRRDALLAQLDDYREHLAEDEAAGVDHGHAHHHETPEAMKEVTAILVKMRSQFDTVSFNAQINDGFRAMSVNPIIPIRRLMVNLVGPIRNILMALTAMIILVSGVSIFVSIYNSMSDRRREIGIMRALGARRGSVFGIVLAESAVLCVFGGVAGWLAGHGLAVVLAPYASTRTGLLLNRWAVNPWEAVLFPVLLVLAVLVGFLPAMTAYRTNVADALGS
ncbi:MAG: FtsX-like permease family protein [Planctomycetaceae bacterium]